MDSFGSVDGFVGRVWIRWEMSERLRELYPVKTLILECNFNKCTHTSYTYNCIFDISFSDNISSQKDRVIYIITIIYAETWG